MRSPHRVRILTDRPSRISKVMKGKSNPQNEDENRKKDYKIMTSTQNTAADVANEAPRPKRKPIFRALITPTSIVESIGKNNKPYATLQGARVVTKKMDRKMTVNAFDKQLAEVRSVLAVGKTVELAVVFDGATLKVIGLPHDKPAAANDASADMAAAA